MKRLTHFHCKPFDAVITTTACVSRFKRSARQTGLPAGSEAIESSGMDLSPCRGCPVGAANERGEALPRRLRTYAPRPGKDAGRDPLNLPAAFPRDVPRAKDNTTMKAPKVQT